jgi:hypothetical protein
MPLPLPAVEIKELSWKEVLAFGIALYQVEKHLLFHAFLGNIKNLKLRSPYSLKGRGQGDAAYRRNKSLPFVQEICKQIANTHSRRLPKMLHNHHKAKFYAA